MSGVYAVPNIHNTPTHLAHFRVGVNALIFEHERILLALRRDIGWWNLPGGGMDT